jgi:FixJ family two-component response regulator
VPVLPLKTDNGYSTDHALPQVLVVEDDAEGSEELISYLRSKGLHCIGVADGISALKAIKEHGSIIVVVADVGLPGLDGVSVARYALSSTNRSQCPGFVFISGNAEIETAVGAMKTGAVDFLTKPLVLSDVYQAVTRAIHLSRLAALTEMKEAALGRMSTMLPANALPVTEVSTGNENHVLPGRLAASPSGPLIVRNIIINGGSGAVDRGGGSDNAGTTLSLDDVTSLIEGVVARLREPLQAKRLFARIDVPDINFAVRLETGCFEVLLWELLSLAIGSALPDDDLLIGLRLRPEFIDLRICADQSGCAGDPDRHGGALPDMNDDLPFEVHVATGNIADQLKSLDGSLRGFVSTRGRQQYEVSIPIPSPD